ncbi:protein of unknown function (plasmid) [Agrobacterium pusense]|uniref:Transposase IS116/IS110/IS902 C-terminal domain-containing protein n=1 Tax=Agrobacterium pusense TaxID=648995 RepID=U4Q7R8_9HYPH|nr:protein of unknown function [Agrobacterium pusense]
MQLVRLLAAWRPDLTAYHDVEATYRIPLKSLGRRYLELHDEIADLDMMIAAIAEDLAPDLIEGNSIEHNSAAQLLLTAGDNPKRLKSEESFPALCGVSPVPASSGKTTRHRLNRVATDLPIARSTSLQLATSGPMTRQSCMSPAKWPRAIPSSMQSRQ